jgi:ubiquinone/menaquinone biosynthesis C-methylase UbiE
MDGSMERQDKATEINVSSTVPKEDWLEDPRGYRARRAHLELLHLIPLKGQLILDAGCGPGTYGMILAQEGNEVIGSDISAESVKAAKDRAHNKGVNFSSVVADSEKLPFKGNSFDVCFCGWTLHHFPDINAAVSECARILKPGGRIAIVEPNESSPAVRFSRFVEDLPLLRTWVLNAGWDTPNRTTHIHSDYTEALEQQGFTGIMVSSCFPGGLSPLPSKPQKGGLSLLSLLLINILIRVRRLLNIVIFKALPGPLNGADLLITGIIKKNREPNHNQGAGDTNTGGRSIPL